MTIRGYSYILSEFSGVKKVFEIRRSITPSKLCVIFLCSTAWTGTVHVDLKEKIEKKKL